MMNSEHGFSGPDWRLKTPVAFVIFNRPDTTARVFAEIAKAKPPKLLLIGDGPRMDRAGEAEKVAATRAVIDRVDWDCEILTNYSDNNLGCRLRVSSGIDWVFAQCEEAIILEDDCLPHPTFFRFCEELLEHYRDDERVAMISGDNFQLGHKWSADSYYFSRYSHIWGWASWRRAWRNYDRALRAWPDVRDGNLLETVITDAAEKKYWEQAFQGVYEGRIDTWDYQWVFASWHHGMVSIMPSVNLVSNIGVGAGATHTDTTSPNSRLPVEPMPFPLQHPAAVFPNREADDRDAEEYTGRGRFYNAADSSNASSSNASSSVNSSNSLMRRAWRTLKRAF